MTRWLTMDASVSPQLDSTLNDSMADGEENHSEASPSSVDPNQVRTHTPQNKVSSDWSQQRSYSMSSVSMNVPCRCRRQKSLQVGLSSSCLTVRRCRSREWSRPLRPPSYSRHKSRLLRWEREMTSDKSCFVVLWRPSQFSRRKILIIWEQFQAKS